LHASSINVFFQHFAADLPLSADDAGPSTFNLVPDEAVTDPAAAEIKMSRVHINKAPGPDDLSNWVLCDFSSQFAGPVCV